VVGDRLTAWDRHVSAMRQFLLLALLANAQAADDYEEPGRAGWGAFAAPPPLSVQAAHDLMPGQGLVVLHVRPGGTADSLGVAPGDIVMSLNGQPVSTRRELRAIVRQAEAGDVVRVAVKRGTSSSTSTLRGEFQARLPRPAGPPPWAGLAPWGMGPPPEMDGSWPPPTAAEQREQLLAERDALTSAAAELASVPRPDVTKAWFIHLEIR